MIRARIRVDGKLEGDLQALSGAPLAAYRGCGERDGRIGHGKRRSRGPRWRELAGTFSCRGRWVSGGRSPSGREWQGAESGEGTIELGFPRPVLWQMQGEAARRAGNPSRQTEEASSEGLGGRDLLTQADPRRPAGQVVGHHLYRQPSAVGGEAARGEMVQPDAVLEVAYGVLDLGVAAVVGLQFQGLSVPVGDEAVIAVGGEQGELGTGRSLNPPNDEPHRGGVALTLEGGVEPVPISEGQ